MITETGKYIDGQGQEWSADELRGFIEKLLNEHIMSEPPAIRARILYRLYAAENMLFCSYGERLA